MKPKLAHHPLVLLLLAILVSCCTCHNTTGCDRFRSKLARLVITEYILHKAAATSFQLPLSCPLHPELDIFSKHEESKKEHRRGQWKCGFCGKVFRSEHYLDNHLDNRHPDETYPGKDVCLADYFDVLHCEFFDAWEEGSVKALREKPCRESQVQNWANSCHALADQCFPRTDGKPARLMHEYFSDNFCGAHTCFRKSQHLLLHRIIQARGHPNYTYRVLGALAIAGVLMFYAALWAHYQYHQAGRGGRDLHRLQPKKGLLSRFQRKKKAY